MATYHWLRIRAAGRGWADGYARLRDSDLPEAEIWGAFSGVFGIGSNELVVVWHGDGDVAVRAVTEAGFEVVESHALVPSVRPEQFEPLTRPGLYVFRFLDVAHDDVDEIVRLSNAAWAGFENTDGYAAETRGLFAQQDRSDPHGVMVLVTWYDGLESWQASRGASPEAAEHFRKRRELTRGTIAYATRLVEV